MIKLNRLGSGLNHKELTKLSQWGVSPSGG